jgi:hypothetical protein
MGRGVGEGIVVGVMGIVVGDVTRGDLSADTERGWFIKG